MQKDFCSKCKEVIDLEKEDWYFSGKQKVAHDKCKNK